MKSIKLILTLTLIVVFAFSCKNNNNPELKTVDIENEVTKELDPNATYAKAEFTIEGMTCQIGCAATIQKKLSKMDGVKSANVSFDKKLAMVEYDEAKVTTTSLAETVVNIADVYTVKDMKTVDEFANGRACSADCKKACENKDCKKDCKEKKTCDAKDKKSCKADCDKKDCKKKDCKEKNACDAKDKKTCESGCEKDCCKAGLKEGEKMTCKPDCKEACCVKK